MFQPPPLPRKYEACIRDLGSAKPEVRASAAHDIVRHAERDQALRAEVVAKLEKALADEAPSVRSAAAVALADLKAGESLPKLLLAIEDDDAHVRQMALTALGEIGDARAEPRLSRALRDTRPEVRYQATIAYCRVAAGDEVAKALALATRDLDMNVRYIAMRLAEDASLADARVIDRAARLLDDESDDVAIAAAIYLTKVGDDRGHPVVLDVVSGALKAQKEDEREAVEVAGAALLTESKPALLRRAFGLASKVRDTCSFHAIIALARLGEDKAIRAIEDDLRSGSKRKREAAVVAAGRAKLTGLVTLVEGAKDVDETLREEALAELRAKQAT